MPNEDGTLIEKAMERFPLQLGSLEGSGVPLPSTHEVPNQPNVAPIQNNVPSPSPKRCYSGNGYQGAFFENSGKPKHPFIVFMTGEATWRPRYWLGRIIRGLRK